MILVEFVVSGKPGAKGRVRFARKTGHAYTPERTVAYESRVAAAAQEAMNGRPPVGAPVAVRLEVCLPIPKSWSKRQTFLADLGLLRPTGRPDLDNYVKVLDACNGVLWDDDSQVVEVHAVKRYDASPGMKITVDVLPTEP